MTNALARWFAGWRLAVRIARRDAARARARTALVAVLIGLPLVGAATLDVLYRSSRPDVEQVVAARLGSQAQAWLSPASPGGSVAPSWTGDDVSFILNGDPNAAVPDQPWPEAQLLAAMARILPAGDGLVPTTRLEGVLVRSGDAAGMLSIREWDYRATPGLVHEVTGHPPAAPGEIALDGGFAAANGLGLGSRLVVPAGGSTASTSGTASTDRELTVVGLLATGQRRAVGDAAIAFPGTIPPGSVPIRFSPWGVGTSWNQFREYFVVGPEPVSPARLRQLGAVGVGGLTRGSTPENLGVPDDAGMLIDDDTAVILTVVVVLLLLQIALMAGPALAVGARRHQQSLALLAATGGDRRQLRRQVLAGGLLAGLTGSLVGTAVGAGVGAWLWTGTDVGAAAVVATAAVRPLDLAALVLIGTGTAVAAALLPARSAARMDVVAALTGRPALTGPRLRVPVVGLLVAAAGAALTVWAASVQHRIGLTFGIALGEIGLVSAIGAAVALLARPASRLPLAPRLALRDSARHRSRTAPAVAATMAAVAGGVTALLYVATQADQMRRFTQLEAAQGVVLVYPTTTDAGESLIRDWPAVRQAVTSALPAGTTAVFRATRDPVTTAVPTPLTAAGKECPEDQALLRPDDPRCDGAWSKGRTGFGLVLDGWVDDGSALSVVTAGADPAAVAALHSGRTVVWDPNLISDDGTVRFQVGDRTVDVPGYLATGQGMLQGAVLSPDAALKMGLPVHQVGLAVSTTRTPTDAELTASLAQVRRVGRVFSDVGGVRLSTPDPGPRAQLLAVAGVAGLIALVGTLTAAGLAAAEGRADQATLSAVGAAAGLRRRLAAAQALVISGPGTVLGLAGGALAGWALVRLLVVPNAVASFGYLGSESVAVPAPNGVPLVVPWTALLVLAIGVPLLTVVVAVVGTRRQPVLLRRRGL
jgi:putative ABC transport system permease protein